MNTRAAFVLTTLLVMGVSASSEAFLPPEEPLLMAVLAGNEKELKALIDAGVNVNKIDDTYGCTALHLAAREGRLEIVKMLRKAGARIYAENKNKEPLVFAAVCSGSTNVLKFLMDEGATTKSRNSDGETLLHHAILCRQVDMTRCLIRLGLDVDAADKKGLSPLHAAASVGDGPAIEDLAKAGANVNAMNWHKETPLHFAAAYDCTNAVRELLKAHSDPNLVSDVGDTPLCQAKSPAVVDLLLKAKADPNIGDNYSNTPLSSAVARKDGSTVVRLLVAAGADVNKRLDHSRTAIFDTIPEDDVVLFRYLLENGADLAVKDDQGQTPGDWIEQYKAKRIADYLAGRQRTAKAK